MVYLQWYCAISNALAPIAATEWVGCNERTTPLRRLNVSGMVPRILVGVFRTSFTGLSSVVNKQLSVEMNSVPVGLEMHQ